MKLWLIAVWLTAAAGTTAHAQSKTVSIGYQAIPAPWISSMLDGRFEKATGYKITWMRHRSGEHALHEFRNHTVQIAYAGSAPIAKAASTGAKLQLFWIASDIHFSEALAVRRDADITEPQDLRGKIVGVPFGSTAHFHLLFALEQFGMTDDDLILRNLKPKEVQRAWLRKEIDAVFIWNPVLGNILSTGRILLPSGWLNRWGKATYDGLIVDPAWAEKHPQFMTAFVRELEKVNTRYRNNPGVWGTKSALTLQQAEVLKTRPRLITRGLRLTRFPSQAQQRTRAWLGAKSFGAAARTLKITSRFLKNHGDIDRVYKDYSPFVTDAWLERAFPK